MDSFNYFNYFTEIEEYFWRKRGAHLLVSPLDWAIVETWQRAGIPLEAVLRGIDSAFESYQRSRRGAGRPLKSLNGTKNTRSRFRARSCAIFCAAISRNWSKPRSELELIPRTPNWRGELRKLGRVSPI